MSDAAAMAYLAKEPPLFEVKALHFIPIFTRFATNRKHYPFVPIYTQSQTFGQILSPLFCWLRRKGFAETQVRGFTSERS